MLTSKLPLCLSKPDFSGWFKAYYSQTPRTFKATAPNLKVPENLQRLVIAISLARCSEIGRYGADSLSRPATRSLQSSIDLLKTQFEQVRREIERIA